MNPYREAFYQRQAEWHGYDKPGFAKEAHDRRVAYYDWYTRGWLPQNRSTPILDIGCGSGQFLYFLRERGYNQAVGIDLDRTQVQVGQDLGLDCRRSTVADFLDAEDPKQTYGLIAMLDILEHFTREELFPILEAVTSRLTPGGRLIVSVPNADSPHASRAVYADITHEIAFTPTSLSELFFCHGLKVTALRDPWPAPVSIMGRGYRAFSTMTRKLEAARLRLLGFDAPKYWSSVVWAMAEKPMQHTSPPA
jgi:2-polyprenyl-3-methyl-5-hydroxy-6-metoxy-1,4-benzoquinol methylase